MVINAKEDLMPSVTGAGRPALSRHWQSLEAAEAEVRGHARFFQSRHSLPQRHSPERAAYAKGAGLFTSTASFAT